MPQFAKAQAWEFVIHDHNADRAGHHYDLRLVDPGTNIAHSWACRNLPMTPGDKVLAVRQPDHTREYTKFRGVLADGYGKGTVDIHKAGMVEVLKSDNAHFRFNLYEGTRTIRFSLIHTGGNNWLWFNHTPTEQSKPHIPRSKPSFGNIPVDQVDYNNANQALAPKIDGAANIFDLRTNKGIDVYSYRPSKKSSELIDHTYRLRFDNVEVPKELNNTTLMGEVFSIDPKTKKVKASQDTTGALVANVWKSREKSPEFGVAIYDVLRYRGKDYSNMPYRDKLQVLNDVNEKIPRLTPPPIAFTPEEKRRLLTQVSLKQHPLTEEGFVIYNLDKSVPTKAKFRDDYDVYVRSIHKGQGQNSDKLGYIKYSFTPDGPIVGKVGGGFTRQERQDIYNNPEQYIGLPMRVYAQGQLRSGALRVPQFKDFRTAELFPK